MAHPYQVSARSPREHADKVSFIIPGVEKAGTTALATYLREHPQIAMPNAEVRFFSQHYDRGIDWYLQHLHTAAHVGEMTNAIGEKTVGYAHNESVPERIHHHFPEVKFVWTFRDPVERIISAYKHRYSYGGEWLPFEAAVRKSSVRKHLFSDIDYLDISTYDAQVKRYLHYFNADQMFFLTSDHLRAAPDQVLRQICTFLGVDADYQFQSPRDQASVNPTSRRPLIAPLQQLSWLYIKRMSPRLHQRIIKLNRRTDRAIKVTLSPQFEAELRAYFRPHNEALAQLTGLDLSAWK